MYDACSKFADQANLKCMYEILTPPRTYGIPLTGCLLKTRDFWLGLFYKIDFCLLACSLKYGFIVKNHCLLNSLLAFFKSMVE